MKNISPLGFRFGAFYDSSTEEAVVGILAVSPGLGEAALVPIRCVVIPRIGWQSGDCLSVREQWPEVQCNAFLVQSANGREETDKRVFPASKGRHVIARPRH